MSMRYDDLGRDAQNVALEQILFLVTDECGRCQMDDWEVEEALSPSELRSRARQHLFSADGAIVGELEDAQA